VANAGKFITLEGGEGTGKSTLLGALEHYLTERGLEVLVTREPGGTPLAERIRDIALFPAKGHEWSPLAQALLMNAAREDHLERHIKPALARGAWVLCDRFADSTRVYQSIGGVSDRVLKQMEDVVVGSHGPDLTLILDASPLDLITRREGRGAKDIFERKGMAFHIAVREAFLKIAKLETERCGLIDALQSPEEVLKQALTLIEKRLDFR